jgi:hypothetical protein
MIQVDNRHNINGSSLFSVVRHNVSWDFVSLFLCGDWYSVAHDKATRAQRNILYE